MSQVEREDGMSGWAAEAIAERERKAPLTAADRELVAARLARIESQAVAYLRALYGDAAK